MSEDPVLRARIPADVDTPDKLVFGLTFRQAAILSVAAAAGYLILRGLTGIVAWPVLVAVLTPLGGLIVAVVIGRRDGVSLDRWLLAAITHRRSHRRLAAAPHGVAAPPSWAPRPDPAAPAVPAPLRLPATAISPAGIVDTGDRAVALVATTTVNVGLRTGAEQAGLVEAYARWLNSLTGPAQIVISAQRVDLSSHAERITDDAAAITNPALSAAAGDYAEFLLDVAADRDPLWRTVTICCTADTPRGRDREAARRAEHTATALSALGVQAKVLHGGEVSAVLAAAVDPYAPVDASWSRTPPGGVVCTGWSDATAVDDRTDAAAVVGAVGPAAVQVSGRDLRIGDGYAATLAVTGYPAEVGVAWLEPLLSWPGRVDMALHIEPLNGAGAATRLSRQRARLEASRRLDADKGRLDDPRTSAAADDAADLADRIARGAAKLFTVAIYLTVHAPTRAELTEAVAQVRAAAASVMLDTVPATWRQLQGWTSTLPLGTDSLAMRRVMDTDALAAAFPLASADLPAPLPGDGTPTGGVLYGLNTASAGVVWWNRWECDNFNSVTLARSGAGKSYLVKLELLRSLYDGVRVSVIDPENEYLRLADAVGGTTIRLGAPGVYLNPLDITPGDRDPEARNRRAMFVHTLVSVLLGQKPPPQELAALDKAINAAYLAAGISNDPDTWRRPAPLLRDVTAVLETAGDPAAATLAARLSPWTTGSFRALFDGPCTTIPVGQLVVWSTRDLADELRPAGMLLALDHIWRDINTPAVTGPTDRKLVIVDEAWTLLRDGEGAKFLNRLAKAGRKRRAGIAVVTQDAADLLSTDLGLAVVSNAATQILLRQAPQAIDVVADTFGLTGGEARALLAARRGEALLVAGSHRVGFQIVASALEHTYCIGDTEHADLQP